MYVRLVASFEFESVVTQKKIMLGTNKFVCTYPIHPVHAQQPPPFLENIIKWRGLLP